MARVVHGDHMKVEGVVAVVQISRATVVSVKFDYDTDGSRTYQSWLLYSLALGRAAETNPTLATRAKIAFLLKYMTAVGWM